MSRAGALRSFARRSRQVVLVAGVVGVVTGLGVALFEAIVVPGLFDRLARLPGWALGAMPMVGLGLAAAALRWVGRGASPATTDAYLVAFHGGSAGDLRGRNVPARMLAAVATLGFGGAMGLEGPSLYLGASVGAWLQRRLRPLFGDADPRLLLVAGAGAGVAAIFKAPATGAVFGLEVPYRGDLARGMLLPSLVASATSYVMYAAINGTTPLFPAHGTPPFALEDLAAAALLGLLAGLGARAFGWLLRRAKAISEASHPGWRVVAAGGVLAALFALTGAFTDRIVTIGAGYRTIDWALDPHRALWLLLAVLVLRCLATAATVAGGGVGGLFIPLVVAGALLGRATGHVLGDVRTDLFTVLGVAAFLGAGYRVPLAAVIFVAETTGRPGFVVPGLIAAVVAELTMGHSSVTTYQRDGGRRGPGRPGEPEVA